jgi:hypothetical protein
LASWYNELVVIVTSPKAGISGSPQSANAVQNLIKKKE